MATSKKASKKKADPTRARHQEEAVEAPRKADAPESRTRDGKNQSNSRDEKSNRNAKQDSKNRNAKQGDSKKTNQGQKKNDRKGSDSKRSDRSKGRNENKRAKGDRKPAPKKARKENVTFGASRAEKEKNQTGKIWVNIGKSISESKEDFIEVICDLAGVMPEDINGVQIDDSFSFIEVRKDYLFDMIKAMNNQEYKGLTITAQQARK